MASISFNQLFELARSLSVECIVGRLLYPIRCRLLSSRYCTEQPTRYEPLGSVITWDTEGRRVDVECTGGVVRLEALAPEVWRLRARRWDAPPFEDQPFSYALTPEVEWHDAALLAEDTDDEVIVHGGAVTCHIQRAPFRLSFYDAGGRPVTQDIHGLGFRGDGAYATRRLAEAEAVYGLGERAFDLNLRGRSLSLWNRDPETYEPGDDPIHLSIPMLVGLRDGLAYGLFFDNPGRARIDLGQTHHDTLHYEVETGELCLYLFAGPGMADVLARYTQLTGRMPLPPLWALGYHQSRWSYYPEAEVRAIAVEFRTRQIPCDVIHLDIHYMDGYRVFTWDRERFPDPPGLIADLRDQGFRVVTIIDPGVMVDPGYHVHDDGLE
ncbi:MAG TPA: TIM-barrel domain-containing protein, partial [Anaerolineae bacterium]|nr:TIM-barrel domain-containing protein [Anaerolineae bacterium]